MPQLFHETPDLVIRRAPVDGLLQPVLGGAQLAFRVGEAAVLDLQCHGPEPVGHIEQVLVRPGDAQALRAGAQAHEHAPLRRVGFRRDQQRVERDLHALAVVWGKHELAPLLHQRLGEGIGEGALRQGEVDRFARRLLAGLVLGLEPDRHRRAGPGMVREIDRRLGVRRVLLVARESERELGRGNEGAALAVVGLLDDAVEGGDAVIVLALVAQGEGAARIDLGRHGEGDFRQPVGNGVDGERHAVGKAGADGELARAFELVALLAHVGALVGLGRQRRQPLARLDLRAAFARDADDHGRMDRGPQVLAAGEVDHERRRAGIERRVDPAVDAEGRGGRLDMAPVEGRSEARADFGSGHEGAGHQGEETCRAQGIAVAPGHVRLRQADAHAADCILGPLAVEGPERPGAGIGRAEGEGVVEDAGRPGGEAGLPVEPVEGPRPARHAQARERPERKQQGGGEKPEADGAPQGRGVEPQAEPGQGEEREDDGERQPEAGPRLLPPEGPAGMGHQTPEPLVRVAAPRRRVRAFAHAKHLPLHDMCSPPFEKLAREPRMTSRQMGTALQQAVTGRPEPGSSLRLAVKGGKPLDLMKSVSIHGSII